MSEKFKPRGNTLCCDCTFMHNGYAPDGSQVPVCYADCNLITNPVTGDRVLDRHLVTIWCDIKNAAGDCGDFKYAESTFSSSIVRGFKCIVGLFGRRMAEEDDNG